MAPAPGAATLELRPAQPADTPLILALIRELAEYERLAHEVVADEARIHDALFGPRPSAQCVLAFVGSEPAGFALYFTSFSTFLGRPGLYLEDLFVRPACRRRGIGRALLAHLARIAVEEGRGRLEWSVLDWNQPAIDFYRSLGAVPMDQWTVFRLTGEPLQQLAAQAG